MRYLGMHQRSHQHWLSILNQSKYKELNSDRYNQGPLVTALENRIAVLLEKPSALFFNKGTTCQLATLKAICESKQNNRIILHPNSHIACDEQDAYQALMGLKGITLGAENTPFIAKDLEDINEFPAVLVVELPLRRAGFKLTQWDELIQMRQWCNTNQVHFHMDGARLWESAPFYDKSWAEISALFDSVYVSLYKGIGGLSGAVLAGDHNLIDGCHSWRNRLGSNMWSTFPTLITALEGLDHNLPAIHQWVARAHELSTALRQIDGLIFDDPHTNGFKIKVIGSVQSMNEKLVAVSDQSNLNICKPFESCSDQSQIFTEIQVGAEHDKITNDEVVNFFKTLLSV